ncbi:HEAT repeat domain-containing protein [Actinoplanes sp. NBRC 101535]|uniref:HEAT repeat domain-containing protein n=1 Tax=Actinoplanes sp. NBRC 101535 TaxID=3032196 RepID=UPI0024A5E7C4|nr:HEAT repeat domain-containing protein [Actinoplanes sp. NBRC 101535]GLY03957.1 hypothetical protein Acsp01_43360 [Actinoplanes sp. NBRC 101535]
MTDTAIPLTGVRDEGWGPRIGAFGVPRLLADLAGGEPPARTTALRGLYRSAPVGEDVRPWVVDALPMLLELVADPSRTDRGRILRLVGDLAGADRTWMAGETLRAKRFLAQRPELPELLADEDPAVREAAAWTLRAIFRLRPGLTGLLWRRYIEEPDPAVRLMLVRSSVITGSVGRGREPVRAFLAWVADSDGDLRVRIEALAELTRMSEPVPPSAALVFDPAAFDPETARATLLDAYREGLNRTPEPVDVDVEPLLTGRRTSAWQWTPGYHRVVTAIRATYRDDVGAHLGLLETMLAMDAGEARLDALGQLPSLVQRLRAPYRPVVRRTTELLRDPDPQVRAAALRVLGSIGEMARPAADEVWATLPREDRWVRPRAGDDRVSWVVQGPRGPVLGPAVTTLAGLGDERVLPMLGRLLDEVPDAGGLYRSIAGFGVRARPLRRTLLRRLRQDPHRVGLLHALTAVAPNDAVDFLDAEPIDLVTLGLLALAGRAVAGRAPAVREALTCGDPVLELAAARAIWQVTGDVAAAAGVYDRYFDNRRADAEHRVAAIDGLAVLGIRVKDRSRRLAKLMNGRVEAAVAASAAAALWRVAGDREAARRLGRVWEAAPRVRPRIARLWAETGDVRYAARYARAELTVVLRHNVSNLGLSPAEISEDERLLSLCRDLAGS